MFEIVDIPVLVGITCSGKSEVSCAIMGAIIKSSKLATYFLSYDLLLLFRRWEQEIFPNIHENSLNVTLLLLYFPVYYSVYIDIFYFLKKKTVSLMV